MADALIDSLTANDYAQILQQRKHKSHKKINSAENQQRGS